MISPAHSRRLVPVATVAAATLALWPVLGSAALGQPRLFTAANYAVIGGSAISNTGSTVITGNIAISPNTASSITGFPPGTVSGATDANNAVAIQAQTDLVTTYNDAAGSTPFTDLSGQDLGGKTLVPGVYRFSSSAQLTGTLTLDGEGSTNATFIFQIGSTLTTAAGSRVVLINGAGSCAVFWQVTSSATLGTTTSFQGNVIALTSITLTTGATVGVGGGVNGGRLLARGGAVTLDSNVITPPAPGCAPQPAPAASSRPVKPRASQSVSVPDTGAVPAMAYGGLPLAWLAPLLLVPGAVFTATALMRRRRADMVIRVAVAADPVTDVPVQH